MSDNLKGMGWLPSLPDQRDLEYKVTAPIIMVLPDEVDLRKQHELPTINQGGLGSCVAHASAHLHYFSQLKQGSKKPIAPSRLFIYYNARAEMGKKYITMDSGTYLRLGAKVMAKFGVCPDSEWPYFVKSYQMKPKASCYSRALKHQALLYRRVDQSLDQLKGCLASGFPFMLGFSVYDSFNEVGKNGIVSLPESSERLRGGHAIYCCGYTKDSFIVQNSWGKSWGDQGYCYFPHSYFTNSSLSNDFWMIEALET